MATYNGQVTGGGLNLRASNSTTSSLLIQIPNNTQIVVSDYPSDSAWYCTTYSGYSGFVMKQYVNVLSSVALQPGAVFGGGLNLRLYPSTAAPTPIQIPNNTAINIATHNSSWASTSYIDYDGFVMSQYVSVGPGGSGGWVTRWIAPGAGQTVNIRPDASQNNPPVAVWSHGTKIEVNAPTSTWSEVRLFGDTTISGWVMTQFLSASDPGGSSAWVTRWIAPGAGQTVNIRPDASQNNPPVAVWPHGTKVEVDAPNSTWSAVRQYGSTITTGWVMTQFLSTTDPGGSGSGTPGVIYKGNRYLSASEMASNAQYVLNYLRAKGWTKNAICGMLGNMEVESKVNPGIWEGLNSGNKSGGYGLTQWTPSTKVTDWLRSKGYPLDDMDGQLQRILHEVQNPSLQWSQRNGYNLSFSAFTTSTQTPAYLGAAFCSNYEKPKNPNYTDRGNKATAWYNKLI